MSRYTNPVPQYLDAAGGPVPNGKLYFYDTGTTTPKDTYADSGLTIPNTNPVILNADGTTPNIFLNGVYKEKFTTSDDVQIWERDPVGGVILEQWGDWAATTTYSQGQIVRGSDGEYYISITNNNLSNDPTTTPAAWSKVVLFVEYNSNETYSIGDVVSEVGGLYRSLVNSNLGNTPSTSPAQWGFPISNYQNVYDAGIDYEEGNIIAGSDNLLYVALVDNGPATTVVDPVGNPATWRPYPYTALDGSLYLPVGPTSARDTTPLEGFARWNTDDGILEVYDGTAWGPAVAQATETFSGTVEIATQAEVEAAASGSVVITPATQQYHPSAAKAWANIDLTGTASIRSSYNVSSIIDNGTGRVTLNFTVAMADTNFVVVATGSNNGTTATTIYEDDATGRTVSSVSLDNVNTGGTGFDSQNINVLVFAKTP